MSLTFFVDLRVNKRASHKEYPVYRAQICRESFQYSEFIFLGSLREWGAYMIKNLSITLSTRFDTMRYFTADKLICFFLGKGSQRWHCKAQGAVPNGRECRTEVDREKPRGPCSCGWCLQQTLQGPHCTGQAVSPSRPASQPPATCPTAEPGVPSVVWRVSGETGTSGREYRSPGSCVWCVRHGQGTKSTTEGEFNSRFAKVELMQMNSTVLFSTLHLNGHTFKRFHPQTQR